MLKLVSELEKGQNFTETAVASVNVNNLPCHTGWKSLSPPSWTPPQPPCPHRTGEPPAPTSRTSWGRSCTQSTGDSSAPFLLLLRVVVVISQADPSPPSTGLLGGLLLQWYQLFWGWAELAAKAGSVGWRFIEGELKGIKTLETKSFTRTAIFSNSTALSAILILYLL